MAIILVVDDESYMRSFLTELLSENYTVLCARNGKEALLITQSIQPNLIITDVEMPVMNGIEMVKQLRQTPKQENLPVIALSTNFHLRVERELMLKSGANFCLPKPINIGLLHRKISQYLEMNQLSDISLVLGQNTKSIAYLGSSKT
jgi:CheY-like chemotaxis protein